MVSVAWPEPLIGTVAIGVAPSVKVTVPTGMPAPRVTVATKVTACP